MLLEPAKRGRGIRVGVAAVAQEQEQARERAQQRADLRDLLGSRALHDVRLAEAVVGRPWHDEEARILLAEQVRRRVAAVRVVRRPEGPMYPAPRAVRVRHEGSVVVVMPPRLRVDAEAVLVVQRGAVGDDFGLARLVLERAHQLLDEARCDLLGRGRRWMNDLGAPVALPAAPEAHLTPVSPRPAQAELELKVVVFGRLVARRRRRAEALRPLPQPPPSHILASRARRTHTRVA